MNEVLVVGSELVRYPYVVPPKSFDGNGTNTGNLLYSYHPNHLGSSSLITNSLGAVTQHVEYVPFGEVFIEERNATWRTPYKFNGKELDEETGLYYYGARYYEPRTGLWLSVDPLAEKYPGVSSYVYCVNNPVMLVDPDGRAVSNFVGAALAAGVEYGGQVIANIIIDGISINAFSKDIDVVDIGVAAVEGFCTSGTSIIKSVTTKAVVRIGSEVVKNTIDVKTNNQGGLDTDINNVSSVIFDTAVGLTSSPIGSVVPKFKTDIIKEISSKTAVKEARRLGPVNRIQRIEIEKKAKQGQLRVKEINNSISRIPSELVGSGTSETAKTLLNNK